MEKRIVTDPSRRKFITSIFPACALTCIGTHGLVAATRHGKNSFLQEQKHKFDKELDRKLTNRQVMAMQYRGVIQVARALEKEMGKEKTIEFLKKATAERMLNYGKTQAGRMPNNNFDTYVNQFRSGYADSLTKEIVEDTEKAFELKVTECIWADAFLRAKAGDIGFAWVCFGDYSWPQGFNPKIKMIRDKTLMEGDTLCNHRYIWEV